MAKTKISEFSSTPGNNTDIDSINIAEGCAPSGINNAIRELMAQLKDFQTGAAGDSFNGPIGTSTAAAGAFTTLSASGNVTLAALTSTRVPYASTGGLLVDSANMTFNGTRLTVADLADSGLTSGRVTYASTGGALVDSANLTFDGTTLTANALTTTNAVTINGGTANGVAYLNGSKVLTTGSALTFDGAELGFTRNSSAFYRATESGAGVVSFFGSFLGVNYIGTTSNHPVAFYQNGSEGMRLTSTGLGIGTSSPTQKLTVLNSSGTYGVAYQPAVQIGNTSSGGTVSANTGLGALVWSTDGTTTPVASIEAIRENPGSGAASGIAFRTGSSGGGTERMRLDSSGNLLVGTTSTAISSSVGIKLLNDSAKRLAIVSSESANAGGESLTMYSTGAGAFRFYVGWGGTVYATSTSISAISDATLKENVRDLETGLTEVMALRPRRFDWKNGDAQDVAGFVAQEVEQVLPELVTDYQYSEGVTKKSLKMGDILPTLVKAIQEQQAIITALTARVAALESN